LDWRSQTRHSLRDSEATQPADPQDGVVSGRGDQRQREVVGESPAASSDANAGGSVVMVYGSDAGDHKADNDPVVVQENRAKAGAQAESDWKNVQSWYQDAEGYLHEICILKLTVVFLDAVAAAVVAVAVVAAAVAVPAVAVPVAAVPVAVAVAEVGRVDPGVLVLMLKALILRPRWRPWRTRLQKRTMCLPSPRAIP